MVPCGRGVQLHFEASILFITFATVACSLQFSSRVLYLASVEESSLEVTSRPDILQVGCVNENGVPVPTVRYNVTSGNSGPFYVHSRNGSILVLEEEEIDYDRGYDFYLFTVECIDLANPKNNDSVYVNITVCPVNEFFPELNVTTISMNVSETLKEGTTLVSTAQPSLNVFSAIDRDRGEHGKITYSISRLNPDSGAIILSYLHLNHTTGALVVIHSLDIDSNLPLTVADSALDVIRITVCDRKNDRDNAADKCPNLAIQIRVDSVNEFNPKFSQKVYHATIPESAEAGTIFNTVEINCTDRDIGRGRFQEIRFFDSHNQSINSLALEGNDNIYFIRLIHPLDFETAQLYNVTLACYDSGGRNDTAQLIVTVTAINEHKPHFTQDNYTFIVNRISTVGREVGRVEATDGDLGHGGDIIYSLQGNGEKFGIRLNGAIYLADNIFATESNAFIFAVTASDGEFNDTAQVHISVSGFLNVIEMALLIGGLVTALLLILIFAIVCYQTRFRIFHRYRREQQEQPNPTIELHDPGVHAEENLYEQTVDNLHYVSVSPQPIPDNISVASGEGGGDEAGGGGEGGEARETGATSGGEDLNLDNNRSKHLINRQSEPKIIDVYITEEGGDTRMDNDNLKKHTS